MKLLIYGKNKKEITDLAKKIGFKIVENNPDLIASFGGDGTFMKCETDYPGLPKFILKGSKICKKCECLSNEELLKKIFDKKFEIIQEMKLEVKGKGKKLIGLNEIVVHNENPRNAIRYEIFINGKKNGTEVIGDGVIISTSFGSTGYYRSITDSFFEVGIGVAFNNSTEQSDHMVIKDNSEIKIKINRGNAVAYADNDSNEILLEDGDEVVIKKSNEVANLVKIR